MRLLEAFEFPFEKVEALDICDNRRLSRPMRRFEIGGIQRAAHPVTRDQLVHPGQAIEVVAVKLTRCRRSNCSETALGAACEHGARSSGDHAIGSQLVDFGIGIARFAQYRLAVLADIGGAVRLHLVLSRDPDRAVDRHGLAVSERHQGLAGKHLGAPVLQPLRCLH
jgi:hypothetical protein